MGGIVGMYHLNGRFADPAELSQMAACLAHRGPDGAGLWNAGPIGLGNTLLFTTPESVNEILPRVKGNGTLVIAADARVDNRAELISSLRLSKRLRRKITDSEVILAAYEKWGELCPERIVGDFAFAIWDEKQQTLFCARDHFGIRPFYYCYQNKRAFIFASEIKALLSSREVSRQLDELRIGYHLAVDVEDKEITFYKDIRRLPPGQSVVLTPERFRRRTYWTLNPERELHLNSDADYAEAFKDIFHEAVRCRLRSDFAMGSALSGGLDSSAVTCMARDLLAEDRGCILHTVSAIFDETSQCDERRYINAVLSQGGLKAHYTYPDRTSPLSSLGEILEVGDEPFSAPTFYIMWDLCRVAAEQRIRILLDGIDGDTAIQHGDSYLAELARAGQWADFAAECKAIARHENLPSVPMLLRLYALPYLGELARERRWRRFAREAGGLAEHLGLRRRQLYWHVAINPLLFEPVRGMWHWRRRCIENHELADKLIRSEFAERISLAERIETLTAHGSEPPRSARQEHHAMLTAGIIPYVFELADKATMAFSIEGRHPFSDRRLVEFCFALPANQKLHRGWTRMILRRSLADSLPDEVLWRGGKTVNSPAVTAALLKYDTSVMEDVILNNHSPLEAYVDMAALRETYSRYRFRKNLHDEMLVWQTVTLALWLTHIGQGG